MEIVAASNAHAAAIETLNSNECFSRVTGYRSRGKVTGSRWILLLLLCAIPCAAPAKNKDSRITKLTDVNFGTRWLKANAEKFGSRADWVGMVAGSSGGHQGLLSALRPNDPRYADATAPELKNADASVAYFVALWPISDPLVPPKEALMTFAPAASA